MFLRIAGGFCLGLGLALIGGLILLVPAIKDALATVSDPQGWYGPLEGLLRGSVVYLVGTVLTLLVGLGLGVTCAVFAARSNGAWSYLGYPTLIAPILYVLLFLQGARQASQAEANRAAAQSKEISRVSTEALAASAERAKAEARVRAVAKYGDPIGPAELDQMGRLLGKLYYPGATLGSHYATRTEPPSVEWPVVTLRCPEATTLEEAHAYYASVGGEGADSVAGTKVLRPGDKESGRLYLRAPKTDDPDRRIAVVLILDGF